MEEKRCLVIKLTPDRGKPWKGCQDNLGWYNILSVHVQKRRCLHTKPGSGYYDHGVYRPNVTWEVSEGYASLPNVILNIA